MSPPVSQIKLLFLSLVKNTNYGIEIVSFIEMVRKHKPSAQSSISEYRRYK